MNTYYLKIADIKINVEFPFEIEVRYESEDFVVPKQEGDIEFEFVKTKDILDIEEEVIYDDLRKVYKIDKQKLIYEFYESPNSKPYAWLFDSDEKKHEIKYLEEKKNCFRYSRNILEVINLEGILNKFGAFILHSSFINWDEKGILFSAPSGTGKSTQADLWKKYEKAKIINGDRSAIRKVDGIWKAYGLPIAGSSGIYKNEKAKISHIIILEKGKENKLTRLSQREAFIKIYSETIVHTWDGNFQNKIINVILELVQSVTIYKYECLADRNAVEFLKKQIIIDTLSQSSTI